MFTGVCQVDPDRVFLSSQIPPELFSTDPSSAEQQEISTLCISPSEETLAASTDRGQLYGISLSLAELNKVPSASLTLILGDLYTKETGFIVLSLFNLVSLLSF